MKFFFVAVEFCCLADWPAAKTYLFRPVDLCSFLTVLVAIATVKR